MTNTESFICVFETIEARDAVLMGGLWYVAGQVIGMDKWSSKASLNSLNGLSAPVWIRLPQLPLAYWDRDNIVRIATMVGQPMWMDAHTDSWGRSSYARICVRIDLNQKLLPGVMVNGLKGRFFQPVEYEGLSAVCFGCGCIGHKEGSCLERGSGDSRATSEKAGLGGGRGREPDGAVRPYSPRSNGASGGGNEANGHVIGDSNPGASASSIEKEKAADVVRDQREALGPWTLVQHRRKPRSAARGELYNGDRPKET